MNIFGGKKMKGHNFFLIGILFILIFGIISFGCDNDNSDEYYVKYEVNSSTIYVGVKLNVTITNENNSNLAIIINASTPWETIIGPVKKGFNARLNVSCETETYNRLTLYTQISVSKNGSPFALKAIDGSDTPRNSVQISYKIDD